MRATLRSLGGRVIRRAGLLPGGVADGLGEDDALEHLVLASQVVIFFPDPPENLYQLRQWYAPFEALDRRVGVTVLAQDSRTARTVRAETSLPVHVTAKTRTVGRLLRDGAARVVLYVGQANANAVALRSVDVAHVFLNHGESDKYVSISNQIKGFDFGFVGGAAGVDRHRSGVMFFDADARLFAIGRPQLPTRGTPDGPTTVLYAPTWEGTQSVNAYSSVVAFGEALVSSLLDDEDMHLIYRPHPRTGASNAAYREADQRIRALLANHPHRAQTDLATDAGPAMRRAHAMIADTSAIATDWLGQGRPLISTVPADPRARVARPARIYETTPRIDVDSAPMTARIVRETLSDPAHTQTIAELFDYYLSGLDADQATEAFVDACAEVARRCEDERARLEHP